MPNGVDQFMPARAYTDEQISQQLNQVLPMIYDIVSGKAAQQGYMPHGDILKTLMAYGPQLGEALQGAGYGGFDPSWVSQYIKPGSVGANTWADLQNYGRSFYGYDNPANPASMDWERAGTGLMNQYQFGGLGDWQTDRMRMLNDLMNMEQFQGMTVNPATGQSGWSLGRVLGGAQDWASMQLQQAWAGIQQTMEDFNRKLDELAAKVTGAPRVPKTD